MHAVGVGRQTTFSLALIASCFAGGVGTSNAGPFPAEIEPSDLRSIDGGDGSVGFVLNGTDIGDQAGKSVSAAAEYEFSRLAGVFTGAIDDDWFKDGNWDMGVVPNTLAKINAGFDVTALIADAGGAGISVTSLEVGKDSGGAVNSLTSEVDILIRDPLKGGSLVSVGSARNIGGLSSGRLDLIGASLIGSPFSSLLIQVSAPLNPPPITSGEGIITVTNGSIMFRDINIGQVFQGGGDSTGSLTVTNGNITSVGIFSRITIGLVFHDSPGNATGSIRLENGLLGGFDDLFIGFPSGSGFADGTLTLVNSEAVFTVTGAIYLGDSDPSSAVVDLQDSYFRGGAAIIAGATEIDLTVDGLSRAAEGNVGAGTYSAIDFASASIDGGVLNIDFGSFVPVNGDTFDLISLGAGETFVGTFFDTVNVLNLGLGFSTAIVPGTATSGESFRLTIVTDTDGDGVADAADNCTEVSNANQRDTDGDSIGNVCDPDVAAPNDCLADFLDLDVYRTNFFQAGDLDTDNDGDGQTNFLDLDIVRSFFFQAPGPSAAGCN